jgi:hypothetical protein
LKENTFILNSLQAREGKNLITARIGQNRSRPAHEFVKSAGGSQYFEARPQIQMVAVRKDPLHSGANEFVGRKRFDRPRRPHGKKAGSL